MLCFCIVVSVILGFIWTFMQVAAIMYTTLNWKTAWTISLDWLVEPDIRWAQARNLGTKFLTLAGLRLNTVKNVIFAQVWRFSGTCTQNMKCLAVCLAVKNTVGIFSNWVFYVQDKEEYAPKLLDCLYNQFVENCSKKGKTAFSWSQNPRKWFRWLSKIKPCHAIRVYWGTGKRSPPKNLAACGRVFLLVLKCTQWLLTIAQETSSRFTGFSSIIDWSCESHDDTQMFIHIRSF